MELNDLILLIGEKDIKKKTAAGNELLKYLSDPSKSVNKGCIGNLVDGLISCINCNNFKTSQNGLDAMCLLMDTIGSEYKDYISCVLPCILVRFGDSKEVIRSRCQTFLLGILKNEILSLADIIESVKPLFTAKNNYAKEGVLGLFTLMFSECDQSSAVKFNSITVQLSTVYYLLHHILKLYCDNNAAVRDKAKETILILYKEMGNELRFEIERNDKNIPAARLYALYLDFDKIIPTEGLLKKISKSAVYKMHYKHPKKEVNQNSIKCENSAIKIMPNLETNDSCKKNISSSTKKNIASKIRSTKTETYNSSAGAVNEDVFLKAFDEVPILHQICARELVDGMKKIIKAISNPNEDWEKQVDALKTVRSYIIAGQNLHEFPPQLCALQTAIQMSVNDLRSQVVREACVTIAFLSKSLSNRCEHFAECIIPLLLSLIANSVKVISSSGQLCIKFVLKYVQSHRLIPIVINHLSSKSKVIRKSCCEFLNEIIHNWPTASLERHAALIQDAIKKGITDADAEARVYSRKAYWSFKKHFPGLAECILKSLGESHKRALARAGMQSDSNSPGLMTNSCTIAMCTVGQCFDHGNSSDERKENHGLQSKSDTNLLNLCQTDEFKENVTIRKNSRTKLFSGINKQSISNLHLSDSITRKFISKSQPCSRSCSPSHKWKKKDYNFANMNLFCTLSKSKLNSHEQATMQSSTANKRSFQYDLDSHKLSVVNISSEFENCEINNEICENAQNMSKDKCCNQQFENTMFYEKNIQSMAQILKTCEISKHPTELKEELEQIRTYLQDGNVLKPLELSKLQEICVRLFENKNTKVNSSFFTTLDVFIESHFLMLTSWFHVLLTKLLNKLGESQLNSIECKIYKCFDTIVTVFPTSLQVSTVFNFINNYAESLNEKVKIATCYYIKRFITEKGITIDFLPQNSNGLIDSNLKAVTEIIKWTECDFENKRCELPTIARDVIIQLFSFNSLDLTQIFKQLANEHQTIVTDLIQDHVLTLDNCSFSHSNSDDSILHTEVVTLPVDSQNASEEKFSMQDDDVFLNKRTQFSCEIKGTSNIEKSHENLENVTSTPDDINVSEVNKFIPSKPNTDKLNEMNMDGRENDLRMKDVTSTPDDISVSEVNKFISSTHNTDKLNEMNMDERDNSLRMKEVLELLRHSIIDDSTSLQRNKLNSNLERNEMFEILINEIRKSSHIVVKDNFKSLLKILLSQMSNCEPSTNILALDCLTEMMNINNLADIFDNYVEFIVLKVLQAFKNRNRGIQRSAELCLMTIGKSLTPGLVIRILVPMIINRDYPLNHAAIKALNNIIKVRDKTYIQLYLNYIFPALKEAYDHEEKSVRKSALMCLVALDSKLGAEELKPYLNSLKKNKLKLYQMYAQQNKSKSS